MDGLNNTSEYLASCRHEIIDLAEEIVGTKFGIMFEDVRFSRYHSIALEAVEGLDVEEIGCESQKFREYIERALEDHRENYVESHD